MRMERSSSKDMDKNDFKMIEERIDMINRLAPICRDIAEALIEAGEPLIGPETQPTDYEKTSRAILDSATFAIFTVIPILQSQGISEATPELIRTKAQFKQVHACCIKCLITTTRSFGKEFKCLLLENKKEVRFKMGGNGESLQ